LALSVLLAPKEQHGRCCTINHPLALSHFYTGFLKTQAINKAQENDQFTSLSSGARCSFSQKQLSRCYEKSRRQNFHITLMLLVYFNHILVRRRPPHLSRRQLLVHRLHNKFIFSSRRQINFSSSRKNDGGRIKFART
jgi:hypothetical protein